MNWSSTPEISVNVNNQSELLNDISDRFASDKGFAIATINLDHVVKLRHDPDFRKAYAAHTHVTADGNPIVWLCRLSGQKDVALTPGSEIIAPIAAHAGREAIKVGLVGSTEASLAKSAAALENANPGLKVTLKHAPEMGFDPVGASADQAIEAIRRSQARLVFLALGAPKQEQFAARAMQNLPNVGFLSIGAGLDFISGEQKRAPHWVRKIAAEWIWRMLGNPRRLAKRYLQCILILPRLLVAAVMTRLRS